MEKKWIGTSAIIRSTIICLKMIGSKGSSFVFDEHFRKWFGILGPECL